jgi:hypothetical protein
MKKIILSLIVIFISCTSQVNTDTGNRIIKVIRHSDDNICTYRIYTDGITSDMNMCAPCSCFSVGDTVVMVKKNHRNTVNESQNQ